MPEVMSAPCALAGGGSVVMTAHRSIARRSRGRRTGTGPELETGDYVSEACPAADRRASTGPLLRFWRERASANPARSAMRWSDRQLRNSTHTEARKHGETAKALGTASRERSSKRFFQHLPRTKHRRRVERSVVPRVRVRRCCCCLWQRCQSPLRNTTRPSDQDQRCHDQRAHRDGERGGRTHQPAATVVFRATQRPDQSSGNRQRQQRSHAPREQRQGEGQGCSGSSPTGCARASNR